MAKKPSLLDDAVARARNAKPGKRPWYEKLSPEQLAELNDAREKWASGVLGDLQIRAFARAIAESAVARGWPMPRTPRIEEWLREAVR